MEPQDITQRYRAAPALPLVCQAYSLHTEVRSGHYPKSKGEGGPGAGLIPSLLPLLVFAWA